MNRSGTSLETCMLAQLFVPARKFSFCFLFCLCSIWKQTTVQKKKKKKVGSNAALSMSCAYEALNRLQASGYF